MKKLSLLAIVLSSTPAAVPAQPASSDIVRASLKARDRVMDNGLLDEDAHRYFSVAVDDLETVDDDRIFPKRERFEKHLSKDIGAFQHIYAFSSHIDKIEAICEFARTRVTSTFDEKKPDMRDPAVTHWYVVVLRFTHEWRRSCNEWDLTRSAELGKSSTIDGKPLQMEQK